MHRPSRFRLTLAALALSATGGAAPALRPVAPPVTAGALEAPPNDEASGLAASRRNPGLIWTHDDSGGRPELFAVDSQGRLRGILAIEGRRNEDWEDLAAAELDGKPWLIVADTGDNFAKRPHVWVHLVAEPSADRVSPTTPINERPAASLKVTYPDGARDCESLAVDTRERAIYLLSKRDPVPRLYRVDIPSPLRDAEVTARFIGEAGRLPQPTAAQKLVRGYLGEHRSWPTGMDFSADGSAAVVLTYGQVLLFPRKQSETWATAFAREPVMLPPHNLTQAEATCFSVDGRAIYVASEKTRQLLRYDLR
ncbi:MAG: hypothetical protein LW690_10340 [Opitutaceae bacterium]|jgi:hypothetical protein|nr:hypothetical protein [Opitutaceae bacterium]